LARQRNDLALSAAQEALAAVPDHPQLIEALGRVQMASGSLNQAVSSFNKLATLEPDSPLAYLRMADAQAAMKQFDAARQSLRKAMAVVPSSPDVVQRMVTLELMAGQLNRAQVLAREVSQSQPETGLGQALEGDVAASAQRWEAAATAYRASMKARPSTAVAMKLHATLVRAKRDTDSKALAAKWLDEHPKDLVFLGYLGDSALAAKAFEDAEKKYERLLTLSPNDVRALNNIAWIKMQAQSADALTFARKAHQLQPDSAAILDTLGLALLAQDLAADAQAVLEKAVALEPGNLSIKLSLAKAYLRLGRREQAKYLLDVLKNAGEKFPLQDEVAKLLAAV
jgi:putative PEP-CTERM system TPR-repeat lipoprotein